MTTSTKEILTAIDRVLAIGDGTANELWSVLTALRGPDSDRHSVKSTSTVPIRRAAFPETAKEFEQRWLIADFGDSASPKSVLLPEEEDWHFRVHAENAAHALELPTLEGRANDTN